jgi:ABC-type sugar transport system substrate-binding protein
VGTVGNPISGNGAGLGRATVDACKGISPCEVVYVSGGFALPFEAKKFEAFKRVTGAVKSIKIVGRGEAGFLREKGYAVAQDLLQANRGLDVYTTSGDQMTFGAEQAMKDQGIKGVKLVGNGASVEAVQAVCQGRWHSSYVYLPYTEAYIGTELAIKAVRGQLKGYQAVPVIKKSPVGEFVTRKNCKRFKPQWKVG